MPTDTVHWTKNSKLIFKTEIEIDYVHELKELYKRMHDWLEQNDFTDPNGQPNYETLYWQRDLPNGLQEHHIWWRAYTFPGIENIDQRTFRYFVKINFQTIAASKQEVMHKGKKWNMWKSNTILRYEGHLQYEWEKGPDSFQSHSLLKGLTERWRRWIYKPRWKQAEAEFIGLMLDLTNSIKSFLELSKLGEPSPSIYPPNALP